MLGRTVRTAGPKVNVLPSERDVPKVPQSKQTNKKRRAHAIFSAAARVDDFWWLFAPMLISVQVCTNLTASNEKPRT